MTKTFEIGGEEYRVTGNPTLGTVKYVQEMEIELMRDVVDDETLLKADQMDDDEAMEKFLENADIEDFKEMMWERATMETLQTIILATNEKLESEDLLDIRAQKFIKIKDACEEELGGTASDFMEELGIGISSTVNRMQQEMEMDLGNDSPQEQLPIGSESSSEQ